MGPVHSVCSIQEGEEMIGRLDFIVRQRGREILRVIYFDSDELWFKQDSMGNVVPLTHEQALRLINAWINHHKEVKATISGGLLHYMQNREIINTEKLMEELKTKMSVTMSGLVFCKR